MLYQLSYANVRKCKQQGVILHLSLRRDSLLLRYACKMVHLEGLKPPTLRVETGCSIQLSYKCKMVSRPRVELGTYNLKGCCSAIELSRHESGGMYET